MKNVILIGAHGHTSAEIIPRLLEQEDVRLTLFLRGANRLKHLASERVSLFEGDATNPSNLNDALKGQDIVISTLGGDDIDVKTDNIVHTMEEARIPCIIAISAGGIYDELPPRFNVWDKRMVGAYRPANLRMAEIIEKSSLAYTLLRPVWLTNKPTEIFELTQKGEMYKGTETSRASIGRFIANVVKNPDTHVNENLGISQPGTDGDRPAAYH